MLYKDLDKSNPNFEYVTKYIVKLTNDEIFNKKKISNILSHHFKYSYFSFIKSNF